MGALKINVSSVDGQSWPLVLHQTLNQKSTGWGPGIKFLNTSDSSGKWAGIGGMSGSEYANNNDLVFYTSAEARFRMNNNTFYPIGDAIYNLGGPTVRWADVYGINFHGKADTVNTVEISRINDFNNFVEICRGKFHIAMLYGNKQLPEFTNAGTSINGWMTGLICCQSDGAFSAFYHSHQSDKLYFASDSNGTNFTRHHQIAYLDQVLPLSGGTMSGALNFANATWNKLGDDVQFGDRNKPGGFFIQGLNGTTNLTFAQHGGAAEGSISFDGTNFNISNYIVGTISNAQKDGDGNTISSTYVPYIKYCDNGLNFNTVVNSGFYRISANNTNCPDGADWGQLLVVHGGGDTITQIYGNYSSGDLFTRSGNPSDVGGSGSWSGWRKLLDSSNYTSYTVTKTGTGASGTWGINITGSASNADTLDGYHADSFASASGSNNYVKVYNSANVVGSSSVTFNDLAKQGFAAAMIHAAEDNPHGEARWVHGLSMAWGAGSNTDWISQLAFGVQDSNGLWYRTNSSACVGKPWKRVLDSSNYNSYSPTLTGGGAHGTWGINITGNAASASQLAYPLHMYGGNAGNPCYPCFARITITGAYTSRPGMIILSSRDRCLCNLQIRFVGENSTDPSTLYLHHDSGNSYHGIFAVKVQAGVWDLYYTKSQYWDDITVYQYSSADFSISFPGGYITSVPSNAISSSPLPNRGTVNYGNSKPTYEDFAGMVYYQLI